MENVKGSAQDDIGASRLLFLGDFASPSWKNFEYTEDHSAMDSTNIIFNLEGPIIKDPERLPLVSEKHNLSNCPAAIKSFDPTRTFVSIANNHYLDFENDAVQRPENYGIQSLGQADGAELVLQIQQQSVVVTAFSFPAPDPLRWRRARRFMRVLSPTEALQHLNDLRRRYPNAIIVAYVHWGYELSRMPYPADRAWARQVSELGINYIFGHHPHVVQPVEQFGNTTVAYSLGNFFLPEGQWHGKHLGYSGLGRNGMVASLTKKGIQFLECHDGQIGWDRIVPEESVLADFDGIDDKEYWLLFRSKRRGQGAIVPKGIPTIQKYTKFSEAALFFWQDIRQLLRNRLTALGMHKPKSSGG